MLIKAQRERYAVPHFNTSDLEITKAILEGCNKLKSPVILGTSKSAIEYAGIKTLYQIVKTLSSNYKIPVALHLDHSPNFELVKACVKNGWTSIMIDTSRFSYLKNIRETKKVVDYCHKRQIPVEAELGRLQGKEGWVKSKEHIFTEPLKAKEFVEKTGCDSLAISIGTSHGAFKFSGKPKLDFKRLKEIKENVKVPLVLHGASSVPKEIVKKAEEYGSRFFGAKGVPPNQIKKAIELGICKVNTDTDLRIAFEAYLHEYLHKNHSVFDYRKIFSVGMEGVQKVVEERIKVLGSKGKI